MYYTLDKTSTCFAIRVDHWFTGVLLTFDVRRPEGCEETSTRGIPLACASATKGGIRADPVDMYGKALILILKKKHCLGRGP